MRPIKLRAWYRGKMYRYVEHCTYPDGSSGVHCIGYRDDGRMFSPDDEAELMQFIGITDKNGKEVYIGDIVECRYTWYGRFIHEVHEVKYDEYMRILPFHDLFAYNDDTGRRVLWGKQLQGKIEIIGTMYENPELIGGCSCTLNIASDAVE